MTQTLENYTQKKGAAYRHPLRWKTMLMWIALTTLFGSAGLRVAYLGGGLVTVGLAHLVGDHLAFFIGFYGVAGAFFGAFLGLGQWLAIRRLAAISCARWCLASAVGCSCWWTMRLLPLLPLRIRSSEPDPYGWPWAIASVFLGVAQWRGMGAATKSHPGWIAVTACAWALYGVIEDWGEIFQYVGMLVPATLTGLAIPVFLLRGVYRAHHALGDK